MSTLRWQLFRWWRRLGWAGTLGIALAIYAFVLFGGLVVPADLRAVATRQQVVALHAEAARQASAPGEPSAESRLSAFYQSFPAPDSATVELDKLFAAAGKESLVLERGDYKLALDKSGRLIRYVISLPVRGSYVQVRRFVRAALAENPALALADIHLKRDAIGTPSVDARIQFVLYLRSA